MERNPPSPIANANVLLVATVVAGLLLAVLLGATLGEGELLPIFVIMGGVALISFAVGLYRYVWQMSIFSIFLSFSFRPFGFTFTSVELTTVLGAAVALLFIWQRKNVKEFALAREPSFRFLRNVIFVWLLYVALHLIYNINIPYRPSEFALSNALKSYFAVSAPLLMLLYFARIPIGMIVGKDFFWTISRLMLLGLLVNLAIRFFQLAGGGGIYIPILGATDNIYALRLFSPVAMLFGIVGLTAPRGRKTVGRHAVYALLLFLGAIGAAVSGGRITLLIGFVGVCVGLVARKKAATLFIVCVVGILGLATANLSARWINHDAHPYLQRSLQWALFEKKGESATDIEGSNNWRRSLFQRAITEWQADPRVIWTGRATYGFSVADETAVSITGRYEAVMESALRRGFTHNLITDLLLAYGIIGLILYLTVCVAMIYFSWRIYRRRDLSPPTENLALASFVTAASWLVYSLVGGNFFPIENVWFMIILVGAFKCGAATVEIERPALQHVDHQEAVIGHGPRKLMAPNRLPSPARRRR